MTYNISILKTRPGAANETLKRMDKWLQDNPFSGELVGCWYAEIGQLNKIIMIHDYSGYGAMASDRDIVFSSADPYGASELLVDFSMEAFSGFPNTTRAEGKDLGPIYEIREYRLKPAGMGPTAEAWAKVLDKRQKISPLAMVMFVRSGPMPRFMHIWPFRSFEERMAKRAEAAAKGVWPPPGGLEHIVEMQSELYLPAPFSPMK